MKVFPYLASACSKSGETATYRLWLFLRSLDQSGRGWIPLAEAIPAYREVTGLGEKQVMRTLAHGEGRWWTRQGNGTLRLHGLERVSKMMGTYERYPVDVPDAGNSLQTFRAYCYAAWVASHGGRQGVTISRARLRAIWGVSASTLRTWEHLGHVTRQTNYAWAEVPGEAIIEQFDSGHWRATTRAGETTLTRQLPSTYTSHLERLPRGMTRKIPREPANDAGGPSRVTLYFRNAKRLWSQLERTGVGGYLLEGKTGVQAWRFYPSRPSVGLCSL